MWVEKCLVEERHLTNGAKRRRDHEIDRKPHGGGNGWDDLRERVGGEEHGVGTDGRLQLNAFRDFELHVAGHALQDLGDICEPCFPVDRMADGFSFSHEDFVHDLVDGVARQEIGDVDGSGLARPVYAIFGLFGGFGLYSRSTRMTWFAEVIVKPRLKQLRDATIAASDGVRANSWMSAKRFLACTSAVMGSTWRSRGGGWRTIAATMVRRPEKTMTFSPRSAAARTSW